MKFLAEGYVDDVLSGRIVAGQWVRLACERHRRDLGRADSAEFDYYFDERAAKVACAFFPTLLRHWKGEWAGEAIQLEGWQQFIVWSIFGWKRADGRRRFRTVYVEVARKNGKTTLAAGIGLYLMVADGEPGAEIYTAATKRDQARIAHKDAAEMVKRSPALKKLIKSFKDNLHSEATSSKFEPLGRDADSLDGLNVHGAIVDEFHAHKTRDLYNKLETATAARRQPLILAITTAGSDRQSVCFEFHDYAEKVVSGAVEDETFFGMVYGLDAGDDWEDELNWIKANPNLDVSKHVDDMRRLAARAREMPAQLNAFLQLHLNEWVAGSERWISPIVWRESGDGAFDEEDLAGRACWGGLDLASTQDVSALVWVFPPTEPGGLFRFVPRFWVPEENVIERSRRDRVPYLQWMRDGLLIGTPGNVMDYDYIYQQVDVDAQRFSVEEIAFDRWGSTQIVNDLQQRGMTMVNFGQGYASMSPVMKEFERLLISRRIAHGDHPVLTWMADNLVARMDPAGNLKPDKGRSREKIDGIVALLMGLSRAIAHEPQTTVYGSRGLRTI